MTPKPKSAGEMADECYKTCMENTLNRPQYFIEQSILAYHKQEVEGLVVALDYIERGAKNASTDTAIGNKEIRMMIQDCYETARDALRKHKESK